jgi:hypothetical protein
VALDYTIDPEQRVVTITGEYSDADAWKALLSRVLHDPRHGPGFAFLRDLRRATTPVDAATVVRIIDAVRAFWPHLQPSRVAILTARELDPAALAAHALADTHRLPIRMFTAYETALEWLLEGLDLDTRGVPHRS